MLSLNSMPIALELVNGRYAGRTLRLDSGNVYRIGAGAIADMAVPDDPSLDSTHFVAATGSQGVEILAVGGNTVAIVGKDLCKPRGVAAPGDWLVAGESIFRVFALDSRPQSSQPSTPLEAAASALLGFRDLHALVDVANDQEWRMRLAGGGAPGAPVLEGFTQTSRAAGEPWLLHAAGNAELIHGIIQRGWGRNCVVFFRSEFSFASVRAFCLAKIVSGPAIRLFDPRWVRVALQALPPDDSQWLGPLREVLLEGRFPRDLQHWARGEHGLFGMQSIDLGPPSVPAIPRCFEVSQQRNRTISLESEAARWTEQPNQAQAPQRTEVLLKRGAALGLTQPEALLVYSIAQTRRLSPELDAMLAKAEPQTRESMLDLFVTAANRKRGLYRHVSSK